MPETLARNMLAADALAAGAAAAGGAGVETWHWLAFGAFVIVLLVADLFVFHRDTREPTLRESAFWTVLWCLIALAFNGLIWAWRGPLHAVNFLNGYLVEWALSMDNVFVFAVIFNYFRVPLKYQYRVLFWGILGAILMRLSFILVGTEVINRYEWVLPLAGLFLIYTGIKLALQGDNEVDPENNILRRLASRLFAVTDNSHGEKFFVRQQGAWAVTPLFLVLLVVESTDVVFAVDSVPAIFGITLDPFTVFTSNIFAILGLRALYFLLAGVMDLFRYLKYGLSAVLVFVGFKMVGTYATHYFGWIEKDEDLVSPIVSLLIILSLLGVSIVASLVSRRQEPPAGGSHALPTTDDDNRPPADQPQD